MNGATPLAIALAVLVFPASPALAKSLCLSNDAASTHLLIKRISTSKNKFGRIEGFVIGAVDTTRRALSGAYAVAPDGSNVSISVSLGSVQVQSGGGSSTLTSRIFYELRWSPGSDTASGRLISVGNVEESEALTVDVVDCRDLF